MMFMRNVLLCASIGRPKFFTIFIQAAIANPTGCIGFRPGNSAICGKATRGFRPSMIGFALPQFCPEALSTHGEFVTLQ